MDEKSAMSWKGLLLSFLAVVAVAQGIMLPWGADILLALLALLIATSELHHRMTAGRRQSGMPQWYAWLTTIMLTGMGILVALSLVTYLSLVGRLGAWLIYLVTVYWLIETMMWWGKKK